MTTANEALSVACPLCGMPPNRMCIYPTSGKTTMRPHRVRYVRFMKGAFS